VFGRLHERGISDHTSMMIVTWNLETGIGREEELEESLFVAVVVDSLLVFRLEHKVVGYMRESEERRRGME